MAGLETAAMLATAGGVDVEVFERGPASRREHVQWDTRIHPGDEKIRRWAGPGWGDGGGLAERLGGRSLCYHGVLLGIEAEALADWPAEWVQRLAGQDGLYETLPGVLAQRFPELRPRRISDRAMQLGLQHVPQAARIEQDTGRFQAYSPLATALRLAADHRSLRTWRGAVRKIRTLSDGRQAVDFVDRYGNYATRNGFAACILTASAICNVQILSQSLERPIVTSLTDHLSVGMLMRLPPADALHDFRHPNIWAGYLPRPELAANIFVQEIPAVMSDDRLVDVNAVVEQVGPPDEYSALSVTPDPGDGFATAQIIPSLSALDIQRLAEVRACIRELAAALADRPLRYAFDTESSSYDVALHAVAGRPAGHCAFYRFPYGAFEHESSTHPIGGSAVNVDSSLRVVELPGVYVAGPGSFPRLGAANPALTILAMSRTLAENVNIEFGLS
jgi:hypothetical protein